MLVPYEKPAQPAGILHVPAEFQLLAFGILSEGSIHTQQGSGKFLDRQDLESHFYAYQATVNQYGLEAEIAPMDNPSEIPPYKRVVKGQVLGVVFSPETGKINVEEYLKYNPHAGEYLDYLQEVLAVIELKETL